MFKTICLFQSTYDLHKSALIFTYSHQSSISSLSKPAYTLLRKHLPVAKSFKIIEGCLEMSYIVFFFIFSLIDFFFI